LDISPNSALIGIKNVYSNHISAHPTSAQVQAVQQLSKVSKGKSSWQEGRHKKKLLFFLLIWVCLPLPFVTGCGLMPKNQAGAQSTPPGPPGGGSTAVDVAIAKTGVLQKPIPYTGTTRPVREVLLRAQVEGRLLNINVGIGDSVKQGQILAQVDDSILMTTLSQEQAELAALQSEVARAETQVSNARARAEQARVELNQARVDAARRATLGAQGAISKQEAELAQTAAQTAEQALRSALEQISTEQKAVAAAQRRVEAQRAAVAQAGERRSYALVASPINGVVLEKVSEPGNLVQPGGEILKLGDFNQVKVVVSVSELELSKIRVGQSVQVTLDAFGNQSSTGQVSRISPAADPTARQIPVEIVIPNSNGRIGSGLLARVNFESTTISRVVVPETALQEEGEQGSRGARQQGNKAAGEPMNTGAEEQRSNPKSAEGTVFVVTGEGDQAKVQARRVQLGDRADSKVEIISGLKPGERFVARSGKPLKDGEPVRLSVISEKR
jgi:multidrug efflux pump subunit AcrA (membrane-fusion protein)